jgi:hypothetical protein
MSALAARIVSLALLLAAPAACDLPESDSADRARGNTAARHPLALEPANAGAAPAPRPACGPGAEIVETYPCAGPCLRTPGAPERIGCLPTTRTCTRSRPAPPCR